MNAHCRNHQCHPLYCLMRDMCSCQKTFLRFVSQILCTMTTSFLRAASSPVLDSISFLRFLLLFSTFLICSGQIGALRLVSFPKKFSGKKNERYQGGNWLSIFKVHWVQYCSCGGSIHGLCSLHTLLHKAHCTLYCTKHTTHWIKHTAHTSQRTEHNTHCTISFAHFTLHSYDHCTLHTV